MPRGFFTRGRLKDSKISNNWPTITKTLLINISTTIFCLFLYSILFQYLGFVISSILLILSLGTFMGNVNFKFNQIKEYFSNGFWTSNSFMEGMRVKYDRNIFVSLEVREKKKIDVRCQFRGLIATCKIFKSDDKIRSKEKDAKKRKNKFITFVTLGYDNNKYISAS